MPKTAILDIDGTLVDTNYQHAIAWHRAFRQHGVPQPVWRLHRSIGMGGDQLVAAVAGDEVENELGDDIRAAEGVLYMALIDEVEPFVAAHDLLDELGRRGHPIVMASSAKDQEVGHYLDLLDAREKAHAWTTSADVETTKPAPDLVLAALEKTGTDPGDAVMVGDSVYDCEAAERAGVPSLAVLTGGFSREELTEAGADRVFETVGDLREALDDTALGVPSGGNG
jgi:phosphoglycolate phosphatase-like HAD superfamily hydrolase